jgi:hypothetical protein
MHVVQYQRPDCSWSGGPKKKRILDFEQGHKTAKFRQKGQLSSALNIYYSNYDAQRLVIASLTALFLCTKLRRKFSFFFLLKNSK